MRRNRQSSDERSTDSERHAGRRERSERGVTITLNYILVLAITATLVAGLLFAGGTFVEDQRERVIEDELRVVGNLIAGDIEQIDRMVQASNQTNAGGDGVPDRAEINQTFQRTVSGTTYNIELDGESEQLVLTSNSPEVTVRVNLTVQTEVVDSFAIGGSTSVRYDPDADGGDGGVVVDDD